MSTRVDTEDIESTRSEKLLAVLMGIFLLVGTVWFYVQVPSWVGDAFSSTSETTLEQARNESSKLEDARYATSEALDTERNELDVAREAYKVALQEKAGIADARAEYDAAQQDYAKADAAARKAATEADAAQKRLDRLENDAAEGARTGTGAWIVALARLGFIAVWTFGSYRLIGQLRRRESRYLALAFSTAAVGAIMALVFGVDYVTDYIDPLDLGPFVLSALGVAATVVAFRVLQKYLAARLPGRRVRKGECPFCGFPLREAGLADGPHCGGCGRDVVAPCSTCHSPRRVGSSYCATCGSA
ncbi:zinc ribbon domain-containing protein [Aeromicrobium duanguangcaii]|uniref:zinc ribbon domain-containing protein n=1 Tax=Aeromicrobium duanguangcaii TaxID=2968086 RepID=UPI0020170995|nr:zinc ribbon domain-containing protein [Aeromicrobium duanguangcaii]MCL3836856.1 hypothetical protein [Aeromicrobium duanguangcaii]